jgi:phage-related protein
LVHSVCASGLTWIELKKVPAVLYRTKQGAEPVRDFILGLDREDRRVVGANIATVEFSWPIGKPTCAPLGLGLWEVRSTLTTSRIARVIFTLHDGQMILLHGFIKKTQKTPQDDLDIARKRMKEVKL